MVRQIPMRSYLTSGFLAAAFVLAPAVAGDAATPPKPPFTVTNDPVHGTVVDTVPQRVCTGTVDQPWPGPDGAPYRVQAIFYRRPDGTPWVRFSWAGKGPLDIPVIELGVSAQWNTPALRRSGAFWWTHYDVWPNGDNRLSGQTVDPYGTIDLTCE
jgi:hypothetical protein